MTSIGYGNGILKSVAYDARYRLSRNTLNTTSSVVADYVYQYDPAGNITQLHDAVSAGYNRDFAYDDLNRLTTANSGASLWGAGSYQHDRMGNLLSSQLGSRTQTFVYSGTTPRIQSLSGTISESVAYDDAGNETNLGLYNPRNQLKQRGQLSHWDNAVLYDYDGRGVRVSTTIRRPQLPPPWGGGTTVRRSLYSPELNLLARTGSSAITVEGYFEWTEYLWFAGIPVAQTFTDPEISPRYTFTDHLGTPILQTDAGGAVVWRVEYEPYGSIYAYRAGDDSDPQALRFPGQEARDDGGLFGEELSYNIFRWYRSGWGRYTQADPLAVFGSGHFLAGKARKWSGPGRYIALRNSIDTSAAAQSDTNGYVYAGANPTGVTDPLGLQPAQCHVTFLKTKPLPGGFCPYVGTCEGLMYPELYLVAGVAKFNRCDICPIECGYFAEMLPITLTVSRWSMKCSWAW